MEDQHQKKTKDPNPREKANIFSVFTFLYTLPIFVRGRKKELNEDDIYSTFSKHRSSILGKQGQHLWNMELEDAAKTKRKPSLLRVLKKMFGVSFIFIGLLLATAELIIRPTRAIMLGKLIKSYSELETDSDSANNLNYYFLTIIGLSFLDAIISEPYYLAGNDLGLRIKAVFSCLIYQKLFKINKSTLNVTTPGHIINLLSTDVHAFERISFLFHYLWIAPLQVILILGLMLHEVGLSSIFGIGFLVMFVPIYVILGRTLATHRSKVCIRRDERIRVTNELIQGINVIKMYAWEMPFANIISKYRKLEIDSITKSAYIKGMFTFFDSIMVISVFMTTASSVLLNNEFNTKAVFVTMALSFIVGVSLTSFLPNSILTFAEARVSLERIDKFLQIEETQLCAQPTNNKYAVSITNGYAKWEKGANQDTLTNLNFEIKKGSLIAIIGTVGCGKTSVFQILQGELPLTQGSLSVHGTLSCASQETWIFSSSVRQNILFGSEMDEERYQNVIKCCALEKDFALLPYGDNTIIGERGALLSGGQKARINLARAVYREADIYLLDDPLSAVDTVVCKDIFQNCIQSFLKDKTVILITHQIQYLKHVDYIIALENGSIQLQGSVSDLENSGFDYAKYLDHKEMDSIDNLEGISKTKDKLELRVPEKFEEKRNVGLIAFSTYKQYILASKNYLLIMFMVASFVFAQISISGSFYFLAHWANTEQRFHSENENIERNFYIHTYCAIAATTIILSLLRLISFVNLTMQASKSLHNSMFSNILRSTLRFFQLNTSGRILNRFSKDMHSMDELLPQFSLISVMSMLSLSGLVGVICIVNPWFLIVTVIAATILFTVRRFYLTPNLSVLRIESIVRSPLYSYVQATLQGLSTIKVFNIQDKLTEEFNEHLDTHTTAKYMSHSLSRAFGYSMDLISFCYVSITILFYMFNKETYGGNVVLIISQGIQFAAVLAWGIRQLTEVENCMVSVERILEYNSIEKERNLESSPSTRPSSSWPSKGRIEFNNVCLKYSQNEPYILKKLNFVVEPCQKIGIVGRTGAGKSSMISALFQLTNIEGSIIIDEIDITKIGLHDLRTKLSIIPQDPVLFSGTIRSNLDPFDDFSDETLWNALDDVSLKSVVNNLSSGLSSLISQDGSNLSMGQRQLICLARAIVRNNKILVLDEATANVDLETDNIIQETIRNKFSHCTVLTVAHRLNTIMDSDKVLVLDTGEIIEFNHPHILLQNKGVFYSMVQQTESKMANNLMRIAEQNYEKYAVQTAHL